MESRQRDLVSVGKAARLVAARGRVYLAREKYVSVVVFSTDKTTLDLLERCFEGASYPHRSGYIWVLSKKGDLKVLVGDLEEHDDPKGAVLTKLKSLL